MSTVLTMVALLLGLSLVAALSRVAAGPSGIDRILGLQLMGTAAVALLAVWGELKGSIFTVDVALVMALLAVVTTTAFVSRGWLDREDPDERG